MSRLRIGMTTLLALVAVAIMAPAAEASFGAEIFEAGTCTAKPCTYKKIEEGSGEQFTQAAAHPTYGITSFELNHTGTGSSRSPEGALRRLRVDVPAGLAANPQALPFCTRKQFEENACPASTQVGTTELEAAATIPILGSEVLALEGTVYNLERAPGLPLEFGIKVAPAEPLVSAVHLYLEGHLSDGHEPSQAAAGVPSGDYHEYFEINGVPDESEIAGGIKVPLHVVKSKLLFEGTKGGNFLTLPSTCSSTTTSYLEVESYEGAISHSVTHTPVGVEGCDKVPFKPTAEVTSPTKTSDSPDGATTIVKVPQKAGAGEINTADIKDAHVTLPEGMTLNPPAANGLETCAPSQIAIGTASPATCPLASKVGTVTIQTDLPPNSLTGSVYLGNPKGGKITKPPFTIYLDAESSAYGVSVKLEGEAIPDPVTGRLEVRFLRNPQLPFSELILTLNGGPRAPLANPLSCGGASTGSNFTPYTGASAALASTPFTTTGCASPLPFSLAQSTSSTSTVAGAYAAYTFTLQRGDGQQYLKELKTVLPAGLVGDIPSVPLCPEPGAQNGECPETSKIGTAAVTVGAGSEPIPFSGPVYLTGPYNGAPYGLSVPVEAAAGPFDLGRVTTRVALGVDPYTSRIVASAGIPTIVEGIPLRLKSLSVSVNRSDFLFNPTNCNAMATDSVLTSTFNASQSVSSPFQLTNCSALAFKPSFSANTSALATKKDGDRLVVSLTQPAHEANIRSVVAQLPLQLPSRLSTLQKACPQATFEANPAGCPKESKVGTATVKTPVLADPLSGPAYFVSHGGAAFPDLDLILQGNGVTVILVGNTNIRGGITTSTFASIPDVPVSSFSLSLPMATNSVLAAYGNLCLKPLLMPTTITAQSGTVFKQNTRISVSSCGIRILKHRVVHHTLILQVRTLGGGLITVKGKGLPKVTKRVSKSTTLKFKIPLTKGGLRLLRKHPRKGLTVGVSVGFKPAKKGAELSAESATIKFKH